jgi:arylsulfatase A-like enzyme
MVDYYPTLAELCGLPLPSHLSGISQAGLLEDSSLAPRQSALTQHRDGYTLRSDRYRYTEWGTEGRDGAELYDHASDPAEMINLAERPEQAETIAALKKQLRQRIEQAKRVPEGLKQIKVADERELRRERNRARGRAKGKAS